MMQENTARDENSVNVALDALMQIEDERQQDEAEEILRAAAEEQRRKEAAAAERRAAEEERRRAAEQARSAAEQAAAEAAERERAAARENELRIRAEAEARARAAEQNRLLDFELEMKRISATRGGTPTWVKVAFAALLLLSAGAVVLVYHTVESDAAGRIARVEQQLADAKQRSADELQLARAATVHVEKRLTETRTKVAELEGQNVALREELASRGTGKGTRPRRGRPGRPAAATGPDPKDDGLGLPDNNDPLDDGSKGGRKDDLLPL